MQRALVALSGFLSPGDMEDYKSSAAHLGQKYDDLADERKILVSRDDTRVVCNEKY